MNEATMAVPAAHEAAAPPGLRVMAILSTLMAFASISTDLYLPALPTIARALGAHAGTMELTISGYLIGFGLGQLLWGPVGDRYGRRAPIAIGLVLFVIGSRVVQAAGGCAGVLLARAMVRDLYERDRAAQMLSTLIAVMAIAPLIGAQILRLASWQAIFWVLTGVGLATLAALFTLPETLPPERRGTEPLSGALARYVDLLRHRRMLGYAGTGGFFYAGIYAYVAETPAVYIGYYHVPTQMYGLLFGAAITGIIAMNMVNRRLVTRLDSDRLLRAGTLGAALSGLCVALAAGSGWGGLAALAVLLSVFAGMSGLIVANVIGGALQRFPKRAGAASALVGAIHYGSGIVGSALVGGDMTIRRRIGRR